MDNSPYIFYPNISTYIDILIQSSETQLSQMGETGVDTGGGVGVAISRTRSGETLLSHDTIVSHLSVGRKPKQAQIPTCCNHKEKASFCTGRRLCQKTKHQLTATKLRNTSMGFVPHNICSDHDIQGKVLDAVASCSFDNRFASDNIETVNFFGN